MLIDFIHKMSKNLNCFLYGLLLDLQLLQTEFCVGEDSRREPTRVSGWKSMIALSAQKTSLWVSTSDGIRICITSKVCSKYSFWEAEEHYSSIVLCQSINPFPNLLSTAATRLDHVSAFAVWGVIYTLDSSPSLPWRQIHNVQCQSKKNPTNNDYYK